MIFVLNAGAAPNIAGFRLTVAGKLIHISGSARDLPGQAPAQVSFVNNGATLVVTERNSNTITAYTVDDGRLSGPFTHASAGQTPFGFAVSRMDLLVVSEAAGGGAGASTVSSYEVDDSGQLRRVTSALSTGQTAACWVAVTRNGRYAFVANAASRSISSLAVARDGMLTVLNASAGQTPANAIDLAMSGNSRYLYALSRDMVSVFRVSADGSLMPVQVVSGFPTTAGGLIAR
jgi:6-phosphogluconolactonase (cycloisomerase 2 family)